MSMATHTLGSVDLPTPPPDSHAPASRNGFDIAAYYRTILDKDQDITAPIAAIESLIALLSASSSTTAAETLATIESSTAELKASVPTQTDAIALSAGTDLFQRYIVTALQTGFPSSTGDGKHGGVDDFVAIRSHLLSNSKTFVQRAKDARISIGHQAGQVISDGDTVLTTGRSRVVCRTLLDAACVGADCVQFNNATGKSAHKTERRDFRVIFVTNPHSDDAQFVQRLREHDVPVAIAPFEALASAMQRATLCLLGGESVLGNGGVISGLGSWQVGLLAKSMRRPLYVVAESHKFVRTYPLGPEDLGLGPQLISFSSTSGKLETDPRRSSSSSSSSSSEQGLHNAQQMCKDYIPPDLITALITESGMQTTGAVTEELIKIWY